MTTTTRTGSKTIIRKGTTVNARDITEFNTTVEKAGKGYDVHVRLNGSTHLIGFAERVSQGGYAFYTLSLTAFPAALKLQAELLDWLGSDVRANGGLSLEEVRKRAGVLSGLWLAGKTLELASA